MSIAAPRTESRGPLDGRSRDTSVDLVVSWQHPLTRAVIPIGLLSREPSGYAFRYLQRARQVEGFRPLLGFPTFDTVYRSDDLFPLFAQRALDDPRRPDYRSNLADLGLSDDATAWEQIVRSSGDSAGDTVKLSPMPTLDGGAWYFASRVVGTRYLSEKTVVVGGLPHGPSSHEEVASLLAGLGVGEQMVLAHEPTNTHSPAATLVCTSAGAPVGYLPDWLARMIHDYILDEASIAIVDQVGHYGGEWYLRVLVRLGQRVGRSLELLLGEEWETVADE